MTTSLRAATVQFQHHANDKNYNLSTMERFIKEAAEQQIQLLAFPEMCVTGYWHVRHLSDAEVRALLPEVRPVHELDGEPQPAVPDVVGHLEPRQPMPGRGAERVKYTWPVRERVTIDLDEAAAAYVTQVSEAISADEETAAYVEELERRVDELDESELPSGETLAAELTRFLREREERGEGGPGPGSEH